MILIESLAYQIKDAKLFEQTRTAAWPELSTSAFIDIARTYLQSGDVATAHQWLEKIPENDTFRAREHGQLLQEIYKQQGNEEELTKLLTRNYHLNPSINSLDKLLEVVGADKQEKLVEDVVSKIRTHTELDVQSVAFLLDIGKIDQAEEYVVKHAHQLNGDYYERLIPLAEALMIRNKPLASSLVYRSLLISILNRGYTKAYPHGVRYLKLLDDLAPSVTNWFELEPHDEFKCNGSDLI